MRHRWIRGSIATLLSSLFMLTAWTLPVAAQNHLSSWEVVGQLGGPTQAVAVQGTYAYLGVGLRLVVLDVSDSAALGEVGTTAPFPHFVEGVAVSGTLAYVAAGGAGLRVVDVSDPANPTEVGAWDSLGYAEGVAVAGSTVYLADGPYGLRVVDVSDPARPTEVGFAYPMNYAFEVAVVECYAYIAATGAGLLIVDISDPAHPVEMGSMDTPGYAYGVAASGSTVYVADGWEGLRVVNVVDPAHPAQVGSYKTPGWAFGVAVSSTLAYVADSFKGLRVVDVSDPAHPGELGGYEVSGGHAGSVAVVGNMAYVADRNWGLWAVSVSDPVHPSQVGFYGPMGYADGIAVAGNYAYVAAATYGLRVVDVSDPAHPVQIGVYDTQAYARSVAVVGNYAYVATLSSGSPANGLYVVDISDPAHPARVGYMHRGPGVRDMAVAGGIAYLADEWGLELVSVSDPHSPTPIGFIDLLEQWGYDETVGVAVSGTLAYVASSFAGLEIVNVSNPISPTLIGAYNSGSSFSQDVAVVSNRAYIADYDGLRVVDVSNPANPTGMGFYDTPGEAYGVAVSGSIAYMADGGMGLSAVDVSDPFSLTPAGAFNTPGFSHEVVVVGSRVYVADGPNGLLILETATGTAANGPGTWLTGGRAIGSSQESPYQSAPSQWRSMNRWSFQRPVPLDLQKPLAPPAAAEVSQQIMGATEKRSESLPEEVSYVWHRGNGATDLISGPATQPVSRVTEIAGTCVVASLADSGAGTLRWCLDNAVGGDTVAFDPAIFPPTSPVTIALSSPFPWLNQGHVAIDASNAGVILDGSSTPPGTAGLVITSDDNTIKGLQIVHFPGDGVHIRDGAKNNLVGGDKLRGSGPLGEGNLLSGNEGSGVGIYGAGTMSNTVTGNFIGTDLSGTVIVGNAKGVAISEGASHNTIGGLTTGERNVIGGSTDSYVADVAIWGAGTEYNVVMGNLIGTDISGNFALRTSPSVEGWVAGVLINGDARRNVIGPSNVINGNYWGVLLSGDGVDNNIIIGNFIGTNISGTAIVGNFSDGIVLNNGPQRNRIGGTTPEEWNIISGNGGNGISIVGARTMSNTVVGNLIGTDASGTVGLGNQGAGGVQVWSPKNRIGGSTPEERNIISSNGCSGVSLMGAEATANIVVGNYIGTDISGTTNLGNGCDGIAVDASNNLVWRNLSSGNVEAGVSVGGNYNIVVGNLIGTDASGTKAIGNDRCGVCAGFMGASFNRIGGTRLEERNLISGNAAGVDIYGPGAVGNLVLGNFIGTDVTGTQSLGNVWVGVRLGQDSRTLVGGTTAQERNVISGNDGHGFDVGADYNFVAGNYIGTDASGTAFIGNGGFGMGIEAEHNVVQSNLIAYDTLAGVRVDLYPYNTIRRNSIHSHAGKGIDLTNGANGGIAAPVIFTTTLGSVNIVGTACASCTVEVFSDAEDEGRVYEGSTIANASGAFTFSKGSPLFGPNITATATDSAGNTSEFSTPQEAWWKRIYLPVILKGQ